MAITITRGKTFQPDEFARAANLHQLIDNATIAGITLDSFGGTVSAVSTTEPGSPSVGNVWTRDESYGFEASTYSTLRERNYIVQTAHGDVSLFTPYGLETTRFVAGAGSTTYPRGMPVRPDGASGATMGAWDLASTAQVWMNIIGTSVEVVSTGTSGRVRIHGLVAARTSPVPNVQPWPPMYHRGAGIEAWAPSSATNLDGVWAQQMSDIASGSNIRVPAWLYGAPVWR